MLSRSTARCALAPFFAWCALAAGGCVVGTTGDVEPAPPATTSDAALPPPAADAGDDARSDADAGAADSSEPSADAAPAGDDGAPAADGWPTVAVGAITGAEPGEPAMIAEGVALANATMRTECFKSFVLSASWTETDGLSQAQIWERLSSRVVTVDVDMYMGSWYQNHVTHTVGYENEPGTVHMNRYYVNTAYMVADNIIHEAEGHSQGFTHYGVKATSVPYGLNDAFEACAPDAP